MRESYYYSLLKSTADKEILDMPIEALGIKASVLEELKKLKSVKRGRYEPILSTVGDLVSYGYSELVSYLSISKPRYDDLREKVYHIEEKLAKLGLKLEGTEFTIGDVRVHELDINNEARNMLEPLKNKIKTLDDVIIHRYDRWLMYTYRNSNALKSMEEALEKYGLRIEGSPNRIDKSKKFPLDKYAQYLSTDYLESKGINVAELGISKRRKTGTAPKVELLNLHEMTLEEIRELELKQAKIMNKHIQTLNEHEIVTIGDLLDAGEQKLRSILGFSTMRILQKKLASYNLKVKGSTVGVENGAIIYGKRGNRSNKALTPDAPEKRDVLALNEEEKKAFMDMKIHEFGFIESITDCFVGSEKYKTIGDLVSTPKDLLKADMTNAGYESLKTALKQYNLKLAKVSKPNHDSLYYDSSKIIPDKNIQNMSEEEKAEFLKTPLKDVGFKDSITIPLSKFETPILTLGDLVNTNTGVLHDHGFAEYPIFAIKQVLSHYGAKLTANRGRYSKKYLNQIEVKSVEKMTGEEKAIFLGQSPKAIGLSDKITNRLAQKGNIHTIGDLVKSTFSYFAFFNT